MVRCQFSRIKRELFFLPAQYGSKTMATPEAINSTIDGSSTGRIISVNAYEPPHSTRTQPRRRWQKGVASSECNSDSARPSSSSFPCIIPPRHRSTPCRPCAELLGVRLRRNHTELPSHCSIAHGVGRSDDYYRRTQAKWYLNRYIDTLFAYYYEFTVR
jgi:hypothetical protein